MNRTNISRVISLAAVSTFLLVLSFAPLVGGETAIKSAAQKANSSTLWDTAGPAAPGGRQPNIRSLDITGAVQVTFAPFLPGEVFAAVGSSSVKQFTSIGTLVDT